DYDLAALALLQPVARGTDNGQDGLAVENRAAGGDVEVVLGHQPFHGRGVLVQPRLKPAFSEALHLGQHAPVLLLAQRWSPGHPSANNRFCRTPSSAAAALGDSNPRSDFSGPRSAAAPG